MLIRPSSLRAPRSTAPFALTPICSPWRLHVARRIVDLARSHGIYLERWASGGEGGLVPSRVDGRVGAVIEDERDCPTHHLRREGDLALRHARFDWRVNS